MEDLYAKSQPHSMQMQRKSLFDDGDSSRALRLTSIGWMFCPSILGQKTWTIYDPTVIKSNLDQNSSLEAFLGTLEKQKVIMKTVTSSSPAG